MPPPPASPIHPRGCVKGVVLRSRLAFIEARGGPALVQSVLSRVPDEHRKVLSELIMSVGWYPFEINETLDKAIAGAIGSPAVLRQMGVQSANDSLGSEHKNLIRSRDPHGLLKHSAQIHKLYYDTGFRTYEWLTAKSAVLRTFECKSFSADDCQTNIGWHETALGLCGGKSPRVAHPKCRASGDACCEYLCSWE